MGYQKVKEKQKEYTKKLFDGKTSKSVKNKKDYQKAVKYLENFIKIFKNDLKEIIIDKKEDEDFYICNLVKKCNGYDISF